ncbi:Haloacid dehalogenase-like hydrolase (HAD) superfamily protein [Euphorbia peplus]|nr:Haloacid dehalogenase-like hydrolase (HAD) superfamily protein [Euphorbia peplus]
MGMMDKTEDPSTVKFKHQTNEDASDEEGDLLSLDDLKNLSTLSLLDERNSTTLQSSPALSIRGPAIHLKKKLLVLDLNGLLADVVSNPPKGCRGDIKIRKQAIFKRPFCIEFLEFCFEKFEVGLWSSRTKRNIDGIVDYLLGDMKRKFLFCWDLSHCTPTTFKTLENRHKQLVFKELRKIWEKCDPGLPWEKGYFNESNTLLLDDSPYKALLNPANTALFPYPYQYQDKMDSALGPGGDLRAYLEHLAESQNVPYFVGQHPLGQNPITEKSETWGFYHQVLATLDTPLPIE